MVVTIRKQLLYVSVMSQHKQFVCDKMQKVLNSIINEHAENAETLSEIESLNVENGAFMDLEIYNDYGRITVGHYQKQGYNKTPDPEATFELNDNNELMFLSMTNCMGQRDEGYDGYEFVEEWAENLELQGFDS